MENEELIQPEVAEAEIPTPEEAEAAQIATTQTEEAPSTEAEYVDEPETESPAPKRGFDRYRHALGFLVYLMTFGLCGLILLCCAMSPLKRWLTQYESVQPEYVESQLYEMVFADPDWDLIYDLAGIKSTSFEGKEHFIAYMEAKTKGKTLSCDRLPGGDIGDRHYTLSVDGEIIATFTMTETSGTSLYANWTLDNVQVFFTREESITIVTHPDCTVYINGVALDDSYIISTTHTVAEEYIPEGLHADRSKVLYVDGLLCRPEIEVVDRSFTKLDVFYTADTDTYSTVIPTTEPMTKEEKSLIQKAAVTQSLFAVRGCTPAQLRKHFDANSALYARLTKAEPFCESYKSYKLDENKIRVTDFYRYSDDLFSARVRLTMKVTTKEDKTLEYNLDTTYFFALHSSGSYRVIGCTDADLMEKIHHVRLTYMYADEILLTQLVATTDKTFPAPEFPGEEATPIAWGIANEAGELTPVLQVAEDGICTLVGDTIAQPTILYPIFP